MLETLKRKLIHLIAKRLLPLVDEDDVIQFAKQGQITRIYIDKQQLSQGEVSNLQAEIRFLQESRIWKILNSYLINLARKRIYQDSKDMTDILFAKTILYTLEVQNTIIKNIKNV